MCLNTKNMFQSNLLPPIFIPIMLVTILFIGRVSIRWLLFAIIFILVFFCFQFFFRAMGTEFLHYNSIQWDNVECRFFILQLTIEKSSLKSGWNRTRFPIKNRQLRNIRRNAWNSPNLNATRQLTGNRLQQYFDLKNNCRL